MGRNILIISASIGSGHMQAALAVRDELIRLSPAAKVIVVDFLAQENPLGNLIKEAYLKMIDVLPNAYDLLYRWSQEPLPGTNVKNITALIMKRRLLHLLNKHQPDLLVFTHPFPCCAAAYLKRTRKLTTPLAAVITDFTAHEMWLHSEIDAYFVANHEVKQSLYEKGIPKSRTFVTGIPIASDFRKRLRDSGAAAMPSPSILIMGGGLGLGAVEKAVLSLQSAKNRFEIIVITGNNDTLREKLLALQMPATHPLIVIGYTRQVSEFMAASSLLITKPGALTCSEALAMELPMLLLNPIPGQEEDNAEYLDRQGVAMRIPSFPMLSTLADMLLSDSKTRLSMQTRASILRKPDAATNVASILLASLSDRKTAFYAS